MKKTLLIIFYILSFSTIIAQNKQEELIKSAFENKEYDQVIKLLKPIADKNDYQEIVHYNLATAYYNKGMIGKSIFHYEKALKINPNFESAKTNLILARKLKIDAFNGHLPIIKKALFYSNLNIFTLKQWAIIASIVSVLAFISFLTYYINNKTLIKKIALAKMLICIIITLAIFGIIIHQQNYLTEQNYGIVMDKQIELKESPRDNAKEIMKVNEGTKFYIKDKTQIWYKIELANDSIGFIKKSWCQTL